MRWRGGGGMERERMGGGDQLQVSESSHLPRRTFSSPLPERRALAIPWRARPSDGAGGVIPSWRMEHHGRKMG